MSGSAAAVQVPAQPPIEEYAIQVADLKKRYGTGDDAVFALRGLSFSIDRGEFIAIIGPSGCGKTTLLNILGALDRPTSGKVYIDGIDISLLGNKELALVRSRKLGFVFQDFNLLSRMSVVENVELPLFIAGAEPAFTRRRALALLGRLGIAHKAHKNVNNISGGERQRVAVARALAFDPPLVLADEPSASLDRAASLDLVSVLTGMAADGRTVVVASHDPDLVAKADVRLFLQHGRLTDVSAAAAA
jgi:putative ABC transport system ATP-binding protein